MIENNHSHGVKYIVTREISPSDFEICSFLSSPWTAYYLHNGQEIRATSLWEDCQETCQWRSWTQWLYC